MKKLKTPEFWMTVVYAVSVLAISFGFETHWIVQAISIISAVLGVGVYNYCQYKIDCKTIDDSYIYANDAETPETGCGGEVVDD